MKILYAIQGTGNGHLSRARDIIPLLKLKADVDILISGTQADLDLPYPVTYKLTGLSFIFGKKGGVDLIQSYKRSQIRNFFKEIKSLPIDKYDLVINDFEPVSAWACYFKRKPCIGLSHQSAVLNKNAPKPAHSDAIGRLVLKNYAPVTASYGFHFKAYSANILLPVIRKEIRDLHVSNLGHFTVYLPAYEDERIIKFLKRLPIVQWHVFSKHCTSEYRKQNIHVSPIKNEAFIESLASCAGVLCGAGFETPAEALFLNKKLMVIPMKNQYEQQCNAAALAEMGVPVIKSLKKKALEKVYEWLISDIKVSVDYPDVTREIIDVLLQEHAPKLKDVKRTSLTINTEPEPTFFTNKLYKESRN